MSRVYDLVVCLPITYRGDIHPASAAIVSCVYCGVRCWIMPRTYNEELPRAKGVACIDCVHAFPDPTEFVEPWAFAKVVLSWRT